MTQEQKAKAYDEALERMKSWARGEHPECFTEAQKAAEFIFPELKESEDEKIRKGLIQGFNECLDSSSYPKNAIKYWHNIVIEDILAWLEKQGEQKLIIDGILTATNYDKMFQNCNVHKFNVGDWVISTLPGIKYPHLITDIRDGYYIFGEDDDHAHIVSNDNILKLWTIQDAKDGDVLAYETDEEDLWIIIYWSLYEPYEGHVHYHALLVNGNFSDKGTCCICINDLKPATKEQRELLFSKMKEARYEWDAKRKKLKKIDARENLTLDGDLMEADCMIAEQKPTWSEEDDYNVQCLVAKVVSDIQNGNVGRNQELIDWLKSLKQKIGG